MIQGCTFNIGPSQAAMKIWCQIAILRHTGKIAVLYNLLNCLATATQMTWLESSQKDLQNEYQESYITCYRSHLLAGKKAKLITESQFYIV